MITVLAMPDDYKSLLSPKETERAIRLIKEFFQTNLAFELNLIRVTAPLFVEGGTGINDDLNGIEQSRLCMLYLRKAHIGEIQASLWPLAMREERQWKGVFLP
jgi:aspartate--ammonia ligase